MSGKTPEFSESASANDSRSAAGRRAFADEGERAEVGDEHQTVPLPVPLDLVGLRHPVDIFCQWFGLDHAARWVLNQKGILFGVRIARLATELIGGEQTAVGQSGAPVGEVDDAADLGGKALPDVREQPFQRRIERSLGHVGPCTPNFPHVGQVTLYRVFGHDFLFHPAHDRRCLVSWPLAIRGVFYASADSHFQAAFWRILFLVCIGSLTGAKNCEG